MEGRERETAFYNTQRDKFLAARSGEENALYVGTFLSLSPSFPPIPMISISLAKCPPLSSYGRPGPEPEPLREVDVPLRDEQLVVGAGNAADGGQTAKAILVLLQLTRRNLQRKND